MAKGNTDNLVSLADRTTEEQREIAVKGGIASGEARRRKKTFKDELEILLEQVSKDGKTNNELASMEVLKKALNGDLKAFEIMRDTIGEKPKEKIEGEFNFNKLEDVL